GIFLSVVAVTLPRWRLTPPVVAVLTFLVYVTGLALLASDWSNSFNGVMRLWIAFSMYPVAVSVLRTQRDVTAFFKTLAIGSFIVVATFGVAQIYPWGWEGYMRGRGFSYGGMGAYATYALAYLTLGGIAAMSLLRTRRQRLFALMIHVLAGVIVMISFRRGAMAGLIVGFAVIVLLGGVRLSAGRVLSAMGLAVPIIAVAFFLFGDRVADLYTARVTQGVQFEMASRFGRVAETKQVWTDFAHGSPRHMLFGTEFFNSTDIFEWLREDRPIHIDYNVILDGAGAVGLLGFLLVYFLIALRFRTRWRRLYRSRYAVGVRAVFWGLLAASLIFSASNQLWVTTPYALFFALLGALQRSAELLPTKRAVAARTQAPVLRAPLPTSLATTYPQAHARTP
ncbi:MAG: hypothetical protein HKN04_04995, partial [Rhodothermaceae bacterium]|nr:hypothetical protein [Rhodothermaceae bacterium]